MDRIFDELIVSYIILIFGAVVVLCGLSVILIYIGYWMGRNSADQPVRSLKNPGKVKKPAAAKGEPEGDLFNDAAFGEPGEERIPTLRQS